VFCLVTKISFAFLFLVPCCFFSCVLNWPITQPLMVNSNINYVNWSGCPGGRGVIGSCWDFFFLFQVNIFSSCLSLSEKCCWHTRERMRFFLVFFSDVPNHDNFLHHALKSFDCDKSMSQREPPAWRLREIKSTLIYETPKTFECLCFYSLFILITSD
jgi:hypothetical protein